MIHLKVVEINGKREVVKTTTSRLKQGDVLLAMVLPVGSNRVKQVEVEKDGELPLLYTKLTHDYEQARIAKEVVAYGGKEIRQAHFDFMVEEGAELGWSKLDQSEIVDFFIKVSKKHDLQFDVDEYNRRITE